MVRLDRAVIRILGKGCAAAVIKRFGAEWKSDSWVAKQAGFKLTAYFLIMFAV
jgi:hypothetical protein